MKITKLESIEDTAHLESENTRGDQTITPPWKCAKCSKEIDLDRELYSHICSAPESELSVEEIKPIIHFARDYIYSLRDAGYDIPEAKRVELEKYLKTLTLQTEARVREEVRKLRHIKNRPNKSAPNGVVAKENYEAGYTRAITDVLQALKKDDE